MDEPNTRKMTSGESLDVFIHADPWGYTQLISEYQKWIVEQIQDPRTSGMSSYLFAKQFFKFLDDTWVLRMPSNKLEKYSGIAPKRAMYTEFLRRFAILNEHEGLE